MGWYLDLILKNIFIVLWPMYCLWLDVWGRDMAFETYRGTWNFRLFLFFSISFIIYETVKQLLHFGSVRELIEFKGLIEHFTGCIGRLVGFKNKKIEEILSTGNEIPGNVHQLLCPAEQVKKIFAEMEIFISKFYNLQIENYDVNILYKPFNGQWKYQFKKDGPKELRTDANSLMRDKSTGHLAVQNREIIFIPQKNNLGPGQQYLPSGRDQQGAKGSIFVAPIFVKHQKGEDIFVFNIITYGKEFMEKWDESLIKTLKFFFSEFTERLRTELTVFCVKYHTDCEEVK